MRRMGPTSATAGRRYGSSQMPDTLIREAHRRVRRRISVLDDDPTGSQTVHDATIVTRFAPKGSSERPQAALRFSISPKAEL